MRGAPYGRRQRRRFVPFLVVNATRRARWMRCSGSLRSQTPSRLPIVLATSRVVAALFSRGYECGERDAHEVEGARRTLQDQALRKRSALRLPGGHELSRMACGIAYPCGCVCDCPRKVLWLAAKRGTGGRHDPHQDRRCQERGRVAVAVSEGGSAAAESFGLGDVSGDFAKMLKGLRRAGAASENSLVGRRP